MDASSATSMNKKQLRALMPRDRSDKARAAYLVSLGYSVVKPVVQEMLRWLGRHDSAVADVFTEFFAASGILAAEDVAERLKATKDDWLTLIIVTKVVSQWPREAIERLTPNPLCWLITNSNEWETRLVAIELLAKHSLTDKEWLDAWLTFVTERLETKIGIARQIAQTYFS